MGHKKRDVIPLSFCIPDLKSPVILCIPIPHTLYHRWLLFHLYRRERYLVYIGLYIPVISSFRRVRRSTLFAILESALPHLWDRAVDMDESKGIALTWQGVTSH